VSNYLQVHRPKVNGDGDGPVKRQGRIALLDIPADLDSESRRVVEYVNQQVWRWNKGDRDEPVDLMPQASTSDAR
jgi:hypothetical protein